MKFYADLYERLKAVSSLDNATADSGTDSEVMTLGQALSISIPDASKRKMYVENVLTPVITKLVRTQDINTLRMASVSERMVVKRNEMTPYLNYLESQDGGAGLTKDLHYQFDEWDIGTTAATVFDFQSSLPDEAKSSRGRRSNTVTCLGNKLVFADLALDMASQQSNIDLLAKEVDLEITRIRRTMDTMLLSNTEVSLEGPAPIPQLGGMLTRSTSYTLDLGGGDFTRTVLQGRIDAIANAAAQNGRGYRQLVCFTNARQLQVVRDIMINEYNGIFPTDRIAFESALMAKMKEFRIPVQVMFESLPGLPLPFIYEPLLPANSSIIMEADLARLIKMNLGGVGGPYVATRPTENFQRLEVVLDFFSLEDPVVESRSKLINHG